MKLIAHRGGSLGPENSIEAMVTAARMGADAVECDIRATKDGALVIYHDEDLSRLTGVCAAVSQVTLEEMRDLLAARSREVLTFDRLCAEYREDVPILLHIKLTAPDAAFAARVAASGLPVIAGVLSPAMLRLFAARLPRERILAFLPRPEDAQDYYAGGAGILRLWEQWLDRVTPDQVRAVCPDAQVFIMACKLRQEPYAGIPLASMDGSFESLDRCAALRADGVLLNDLAMALRWRSR